MKKNLLFIAFAIITTLFSCTSDEYEIQSKKKIEKPIDSIKAIPDDGPGDGVPPPPPPPPPKGL